MHYQSKKTPEGSEPGSCTKGYIVDDSQKHRTRKRHKINFFEVAGDSAPTLRASTYAHEGRSNHRSTRIFDLHDESLKLALCHNQGRFIVDAKAAGLDSELPYQTFATMPVSSENYLYGMMTGRFP